VEEWKKYSGIITNFNFKTAKDLPGTSSMMTEPGSQASGIFKLSISLNKLSEMSVSGISEMSGVSFNKPAKRVF